MQITSIGAGLFSDLSIAAASTDPVFASLDSQVEFDPLFASLIESVGGTKGVNTFVRVKNVREFPSMGTPPNIVNVPTYGQKTSQQIQGQSDAPNLEITVNYVPAEWAAGTVLGSMVGDGQRYVFRFALMNSEPAGYLSVAGVGGLGAKMGATGTDNENSVYYWVGKIEALQVNPQLTDSNTATITMSIQSKFYGAYTIAKI